MKTNHKHILWECMYTYLNKYHKLVLTSRSILQIKTGNKIYTGSTENFGKQNFLSHFNVHEHHARKSFKTVITQLPS